MTATSPSDAKHPASSNGRHPVFRVPIVGITVVLVLGLLLLLLELALRMLGIGYGHAPMEGHPMLHHVHPSNYSYVVAYPSGEFGGFAVHYDASGQRIPPEPRQHPADAVRIAVMGDSFVEGNQVRWQDSFVGRIQQALGDEAWVKNYGVTGYSPVLGYLAWKAQVAAFGSDIVLYVLCNNDAWDDRRYLKTGVFENGELVAVRGPGNALTSILRRFYVARFLRRYQLLLEYRLGRGDSDTNGRMVDGVLEPNPGVTPLTEEYVWKLRNAVEASGARFMLTAVPSKYNYVHRLKADDKSFSSAWRAWAHEHDVEFIDVERHFDMKQGPSQPKAFFVSDIHFTPYGHWLFADAVLAHLGTSWRRGHGTGRLGADRL